MACGHPVLSQLEYSPIIFTRHCSGHLLTIIPNIILLSQPQSTSMAPFHFDLCSGWYGQVAIYEILKSEYDRPCKSQYDEVLLKTFIFQVSYEIIASFSLRKAQELAKWILYIVFHGLFFFFFKLRKLKHVTLERTKWLSLKVCPINKNILKVHCTKNQ